MMLNLKNIKRIQVIENYIHFINIQTVVIFTARRKNKTQSVVGNFRILFRIQDISFGFYFGHNPKPQFNRSILDISYFAKTRLLGKKCFQNRFRFVVKFCLTAFHRFAQNLAERFSNQFADLDRFKKTSVNQDDFCFRFAFSSNQIENFTLR